jgi:protein ImuB
MSVACLLAPRFELIAACGGRRDLLRAPAALAPEPGGTQSVGTVSGAGEAQGVRRGMPLGEALSRCPGLALVPPDPGRAEGLWERALEGLERIGAEVESPRPGEAFFATAGLRGLHGSLARTLLAARRAAPMPTRVAAAPTRLAAFAAASSSRARARPRVVSPPELQGFLAGVPVALLTAHLEGDPTSALATALEQLGVVRVGDLAALPTEAVADRFGEKGLAAHRVARGREEPLRPRRAEGELDETLELPEAAAGAQLRRALELLVDRLLAAPMRRARTIRSLRLAAALAGGGSWRRELPLRRPSAAAEILLLGLAPKLDELPAPAVSLSLRATAFGPPAADQLELAHRPEEVRRRRLGEAVRQVRAAAGPGALLQVLEVDSSSRVPERWSMLTPFRDR